MCDQMLTICLRRVGSGVFGDIKLGVVFTIPFRPLFVNSKEAGGQHSCCLRINGSLASNKRAEPTTTPLTRNDFAILYAPVMYSLSYRKERFEVGEKTRPL